MGVSRECGFSVAMPIAENIARHTINITHAHKRPNEAEVSIPLFEMRFFGGGIFLIFLIFLIFFIFFIYATTTTCFLFKYIKFARDVLINVTGLPVGIFIFFGTFLTFCLLYFLATLILRFVFNAIGLARFGKAAISLGKGK